MAFNGIQVSVVWALLLLSPCGVMGNSLPNLTIMGCLPMTGSNWYGGGACLPPTLMALDIINSRDDILGGYNLQFIYKDTMCDPGITVNAVYKMLYTPPVKHFITGPGCSVAAEAVARSTHMWNLTHVTDHFLQLVKTTAPDVQIISQEIFNRDPMQRIQYLKERDARIIFGGGYENHAREILCAAFRIGLYGPKVVWVFPGWYGDFWWRTSIEGLQCTSEEMDEAAEGHLMTAFPYYNQDEDQRGIAGINVREFWDQFTSHPLYRPDLVLFQKLSGNAFDSTIGAALALNCTEAYLKQIGHSKTLADFEYSDGDIGDIITECTRNLTFLGLSGHLDLTKGDNIKPVKLEQIYNLQRRQVGMYDHGNQSQTDGWHIVWKDGGIKWRGGYAPRDSTQVTVVEITVPPYLYLVMSAFASFGILTSLTLFLFNLQHRNHVFVKLSSPNINSVLLLGCICTYSTVFMHSYTRENVALCKIRAFTLTLGFSTAFGAMFSKTWRVYKIFSNKKLLRLKIKDSQLVGIVGALLTVLTAVLVLHEIIDPLVTETQFLKADVYTNGNDAEIHPYIRKCVSRYQSYFSWTIYIIEGVLLVFGAFLSFETRKVRITALNDSHQIGMCLYNVVALSTVGLTLSLALDTHVTLVYGLISAFIVLGTTATQLIVFVPKIMAVYYPHRVEQNSTIDVPHGGRVAVRTPITKPDVKNSSTLSASNPSNMAGSSTNTDNTPIVSIDTAAPPNNSGNTLEPIV